MKKLGILALTLVFMVSVLSSCVNVSTAGTIDGKDVSIGTYKYYLAVTANTFWAENGYPQDYETFKNIETEGLLAEDYIKNEAWNELVVDMAALKLFDEMNLSFTEEEDSGIDSYINAMIQNAGGSSSFEKQLKDELGLTLSEYKQLQKDLFKVSRLKTELTGDGGELSVSEEDVKEVLASDYAWVKHILISTRDSNDVPLPDDQKELKRLLAEEILKELNEGADFDELMFENTEDPGIASAPDGYVFTKGEMVQVFEDAAFSMNAGEITDLVESDFGYHIIKKLDILSDPYPAEYAGTSIKSGLSEVPFEAYITANAASISATMNANKISEISLKDFMGFIE